MLASRKPGLVVADFGPGLLGLQYEAAALVEVDAQGRGQGLALAALHAAFEDVVVVGGLVAGGMRGLDAYRLAELREEHLVVGALGASARHAPFGDKTLDVHARPSRAHLA